MPTLSLLPTHVATCTDDDRRSLLRFAPADAVCDVCESSPAHWQVLSTGSPVCEVCAGDLSWRITPLDLAEMRHEAWGLHSQVQDHLGGEQDYLTDDALSIAYNLADLLDLLTGV